MNDKKLWVCTKCMDSCKITMTGTPKACYRGITPE